MHFNPYYVALRKVQQLAATHDLGARTVSSTEQRTSTLSAAPVPRATIAWTFDETAQPADLMQPLTALQSLPAVVKHVEPQAVTQDAPMDPGLWFSFAATGTFGVMKRDTGSSEERRAWIAYWFMEIERPERGDARFIVLTGTPYSNLRNSWDGSFPGNRSGSGTETFFDLCRDLVPELAPPSDAHPIDSTRGDDRWYFGAAADIGHMPDRQWGVSEGIAECLRIIRTDGRDYTSSENRLPVRELIIATPLYVQWARPEQPHPVTLSPPRQGLFASIRRSLSRPAS
jgi:hypothetical protein